MKKLNLPKSRYVVANPFKRMGSFLLDLLILNIIVISAFSSYFESIIPFDQDFAKTYLYLTTHSEVLMTIYYCFFSIGIIMLLYFAYMEYKYSQTLGMMIFNIHAESIEDGKKLTFFQCILRNIYLIPLFPIFFLWVIDPLFFLFKGERLSERFSKTKTTEEVLSNENFF